MKFLTIALALSGVSTASLGAQVELPARSGVVLAPASQRRTDCTYTRTTNSVGDIIFGRANIATNCRDVNSRADGAWYQVGQGRDNNSIYERRVRDANGNLVVQRARRNPNGTFTIFNTRVSNANDKEWRKAQKAQQKALKKQEKAENKAVDANFKASMKADKGKNKNKNKNK